MTDNNAIPEQEIPPTPKKRRLGLKLLLILVLFIVLLVVCLPMIASTGFVRGIVLAQVNKNLKGSVAVDDLSVGWFSGTSLRNVKVYDEKRLAVSLASLQTNVSLFDVIRGHLTGLDIKIDGIQADVYVDADGTTNLEKIAGDQPATPEPADTTPTKLPDISGVVQLTNATVNLHREGYAEPIRLDLAAKVDIPGINGEIRNNLQLTMRSAEGSGRLIVDGSATAFKNNTLDIDTLAARQIVQLRDFDLRSLTAFLAPDSGIGLIEGATDGTINVVVKSMQDATIDGSIISKNFAVGGEALQGDIVRSKELTIEIAPIHFVGDSNGVIEQGRITLGTAERGMRIAIDQAEITVAADTTIAALANLAENKVPGSNGFVRVNVNAKVDQLAAQLKRTLALAEGVEVTSGQFSIPAELQLKPDRALVSASVKLENVAGRNAGQVITLAPVQLELAATSLGGGGEIPDLRDIRGSLQTGFATGSIDGANIGAVQAHFKGQLDQLQQQLSQFVDFQGVTLAGSFGIDLSSSGDLTQPEGRARVELNGVMRDLNVQGLSEGGALQEPRVVFSASATLQRGTEQPIAAIEGLDARAATGREDQPTVDVYVKADVKMLPDGNISVSSFDVPRVNVRLPELQQTFAPLLPALSEQGLILKSGYISLETSGQYVDNVLVLRSMQANIDTLAINQAAAGGTPSVVIEPMSLTFDTAGRIELGTDRTSVALSQLSLVDGQNMIGLKKLGTEDVKIDQTANGVVASGRIQATASLAYINGILQRLNQSGVTVQTDMGQVKRGFFVGDLALASEPDGGLALKGKADISNLVIETGTNKALAPQNVTVTFDTAVSGDFATINARSVKVESALVQADVSNLQLVMSDDPAASALDMVRGGQVQAKVPDLGKVMTVANAFTVPAAPAPVAAGETPAPEVVLTGGAIHLTVKIAQPQGGTGIDLNVTGNNVAFTAGQASHVMPVFTIQTAAAIADNGNTLRADTLQADLGVASISATKPLVVQNLASLSGEEGAAPLSINGEIQGTGDVARILELVNALGGSTEKPQVAGTLQLKQVFDTAGDVVNASGNIDVRNFVATSEGSTIQEDLISLTNEVAINTALSNVNISGVQLSAASSKAVDLQLKGTINDYLVKREMDLVADVHYDAAKLWQLVKPMLAPDTQAMVLNIAGDHRREFVVKGAYPADLPFDEAIKQLTASGGVGLEAISLSQGLEMSNFDLPFNLSNGVFKTDFAKQVAGQPFVPTATVNGGVLNLGNISAELAKDGIRITTPENYVLVRRISMNPALADSVVGKFINPLWQNAQQAKGQVEVKIINCQRLNLSQFSDAAALQQATATPAQPQQGPSAFDQWKQDPSSVPVTVQTAGAGDMYGSAVMLVSVTDVQIGGPWVSQVGKVFGDNVFKHDAIAGNIKEAKITVRNGKLEQDIPLQIDNQHTLHFSGGVNLLNLDLQGMQMELPMSLFKNFIEKNEKIKPFLPDTLKMPITGSMSHWDLKLDETVRSAVDDAFKKSITSGVTDLLKQKEEKKNPPAQTPAPAPKQGSAPAARPK